MYFIDNSLSTKRVSPLYSRGLTDIYLLISTTQTHSSVILQLGDTEYTIIEVMKLTLKFCKIPKAIAHGFFQKNGSEITSNFYYIF